MAPRKAAVAEAERRSVRSRPSSPAEDESAPTCAHPWCRTALVIPPTGRHPLYCSERCRKGAFNLRRQSERRAAEAAAAIERERAYRSFVRDLAIDLAELPGKAAVIDAIEEWLHRDQFGTTPGHRVDLLDGLRRFVASAQLRGRARLVAES